MQPADADGDHRHLELVGELAGMLAHDLANRLAVARLTAEVLGNRPDLPGDLADRVATVVTATTEASELVQQLSAVAGRRAAPAHEVDVGRLLQELTPLLRSALGRGSLVVAAGSALVRADRRDVEELLLRLVLSGRDRHNTDVSIDVRDDRDEVLVVVRRPADDAVSEPSTARIAALAEAAGGTFVAERGDDHRLLTVRLPAVAAGEGGVGPGEGIEAVTVLVVEDDPDLRDLVRDALEGEGHRVHAVGDADAAFIHPVVTQGRLDLLVTDVELPGRSGLELAAKLAADGIRILVISGHSEAVLGDDLPEGAVVLDKPFGVFELRASTRRALR